MTGTPERGTILVVDDNPTNLDVLFEYLDEAGFSVLIAEDGYIRFWIRDNGEGMTKEEQDILFTEFTRLKQVKKVEGHGLGLSIVRRIVEKLGGKVGVDSQKGEGSTFYFTTSIGII